MPNGDPGARGAEPIEKIAASVGFSDPERMRRAFLRLFGQPPQAMKRAARLGRHQAQPGPGARLATADPRARAERGAEGATLAAGN